MNDTLILKANITAGYYTPTGFMQVTAATLYDATEIFDYPDGNTPTLGSHHTLTALGLNHVPVEADGDVWFILSPEEANTYLTYKDALEGSLLLQGVFNILEADLNLKMRLGETLLVSWLLTNLTDTYELLTTLIKKEKPNA